MVWTHVQICVKLFFVSSSTFVNFERVESQPPSIENRCLCHLQVMDTLMHLNLCMCDSGLRPQMTQTLAWKTVIWGTEFDQFAVTPQRRDELANYIQRASGVSNGKELAI